MNEVLSVSSLITRLIAVALALGLAGTLLDNAIQVKKAAKTAVTTQGISYLKWNQALLKRKSK